MTYEEILIEFCQNHKEAIVLTAENRALIRSLPSKIPDQFIDTGITEQTMIGMAAGLALRGRKPIVHALAAFLTMRAFEFIRTDIGLPELNVKLVGYIPGILSEANGPTHQAIEDIALMRSVNGMDILAPADEEDALKCLRDTLDSPRPTYIRYSHRKPLVNHEPYRYGKAEVVFQGREIAILTYGALFNEAYATAQILISKGISVRLINMRSLRPLDELEVSRAVRECSYTVVIEDHVLVGGLYSMVTELMVRRRISAPVMSVAIKNSGFVPALLNEVLELEQLKGTPLAEKIMSAWAEERRTKTQESSRIEQIKETYYA